MSPAITLALLSVNVVAFACSVYFNQQAAAIAMPIRTGISQGVRISKQHRLLLLNGVWIAPVISQFALCVLMGLFNLQIGRETQSSGPGFVAYLTVFLWTVAAAGTLGLGINERLAIRDELHGFDDASEQSTR